MQICWVSFRNKTSTVRFPFGYVGQQLSAQQMRQCQVVEKILHEFFAGDTKFKVILAVAILARTRA